ncbi:MAG: stage II sporulation protein M [Candidatus Argoarchaeum ethanivorans]|uniref:Stage II sporulation protein M n=1 Tax=Candidatus Argoarchaeum ethanivorans TaxID=2608793 RepID=A0A8B3S2U1_9EURY|nr:MAG: stage II sporulation protein M [Candidatus Argoarchaeum ethanivorans]
MQNGKIKTGYHNDMQYLRTLGSYFLAIIVIFIISLAAGYCYPFYFPEEATASFEDIGGMFEWITALHPVLLMLAIFANNALKSFAALLLGLGFGIIPVLFVASNGFIVGLVVNLSSKTEGLLFTVAAITPHGIIEIPMILLSAAIGLRLGCLMFSVIKGKTADIKYEVKKSVTFYLHWIMPLLFLSALIECFITPLVILVVL